MRTPVIDDGLLAQVLAAYPLRAPRVLGLLAASNRNENHLVTDAAGDHYVLRRYRRNPDGHRIEFQVCFQQHLYQQGFATSRLIETMTGEGCVSLAGIWWVLFTYVEGTEYDFGCVAQVAEAGRRLAQFHLIAETFPGEEVVTDFDPPIREWWENWDTNLQGLRDLLTGSPVQDELAYLEDWWRRFTRQWPPARLDALPTGWVHGDYHGRNMVFVGVELRGLFDFDPVNRGALAFDIAYGTYMFGREGRGLTHIRTPVAQVFLDAYAGIRPFTMDEWAVLPMMLVLWWAPHPRFYAHMRRDGEDLMARLRRDVGMMQGLEQELQRLPHLWSRRGSG